jgi:hypothetical protein
MDLAGSWRRILALINPSGLDCGAVRPLPDTGVAEADAAKYGGKTFLLEIKSLGKLGSRHANCGTEEKLLPTDAPPG